MEIRPGVIFNRLFPAPLDGVSVAVFQMFQVCRRECGRNEAATALVPTARPAVPTTGRRRLRRQQVRPLTALETVFPRRSAVGRAVGLSGPTSPNMGASTKATDRYMIQAEIPNPGWAPPTAGPHRKKKSRIQGESRGGNLRMPSACPGSRTSRLPRSVGVGRLRNQLATGLALDALRRPAQQ